jgi:hypothetical protein
LSTDLIDDLTFAQQMVAKYQALLLSSAGLTKVSIDNQEVRVADLEKAYGFWQRKLAALTNTRPRVVSIDLRDSP